MEVSQVLLVCNGVSLDPELFPVFFCIFVSYANPNERVLHPSPMLGIDITVMATMTKSHLSPKS